MSAPGTVADIQITPPNVRFWGLSRHLSRTSRATGAGLRQPVLLYCVIAVLLNAVLALAWVLRREVAHNHSLAAQVIELQTQLKNR